MVVNYRSLAKRHLESAKLQLNTKKELNLKYAALELRMAMEAITYDRAIAYKDEFPPEEYETWQPQKVMLVLLEIDSIADQNRSIAFAPMKHDGSVPSEMISLGTDVVLNMRVLKKHYHAIGSYLHMLSMKNMRAGESIDYIKFRKRCDDIYTYLEGVLASKCYNVTLGRFATLKCQSCKSPVRKRISSGQKEVVAECYQCKASYTLTKESDGKVKWTPCSQEIFCSNSDCQHPIILWQYQVAVGKHWKCTECGGQNEIVLGVQCSKK